MRLANTWKILIIPTSCNRVIPFLRALNNNIKPDLIDFYTSANFTNLN